jgi:NSS family neurotransmitter:Na+ symporter
LGGISKKLKGNKMSDSSPRFSSRFAFLVSALGIAVGTGNIWRFPRIAASNGGDDGAGSFLIAWVTFLFLWSIPLIIVEYVMGRTSRKGTVGANNQRVIWYDFIFCY